MKKIHQIPVIFVLLIMTFSFPCVSLVSAGSIVDQNGKTITFDHPFQRIISLYPAHTENLARLGIHDQMIGISPGTESLINESKPLFSYKDNPEKFIAASPDLVLIRPMIEHAYPDFVTQLQKSGIVVVSLQPTSVTGMYDYWKKLGHLTGKIEAAEMMISDFKTELKHYQELIKDVPANKRPKVYFESIHKKMKTFSPTAMAIFCLENAGGINVASKAKPRRSSNIASYGKEHILSHAAEIDVFLAQVGRMNPVSQEIIEQEPGFMAIKAVKNRKIFLINEQIVSRPTVRLLEGIRAIHTLLYPVN